MQFCWIVKKLGWLAKKKKFENHNENFVRIIFVPSLSWEQFKFWVQWPSCFLLLFFLLEILSHDFIARKFKFLLKRVCVCVCVRVCVCAILSIRRGIKWSITLSQRNCFTQLSSSKLWTNYKQIKTKTFFA